MKHGQARETERDAERLKAKQSREKRGQAIQGDVVKRRL